jgi:hypothetical protein
VLTFGNRQNEYISQPEIRSVSVSKATHFFFIYIICREPPRFVAKTHVGRKWYQLTDIVPVLGAGFLFYFKGPPSSILQKMFCHYLSPNYWLCVNW